MSDTAHRVKQARVANLIFYFQALSCAILAAWGYYRKLDVALEGASILFVFGTLILLWSQVTWEKRSGQISFSRRQGLMLALRFNFFPLVGIALYLCLDSGLASFLTATARRLVLTDINRQIFVWLRAPLSILISLFVFEWARPWIFRLQIPTARLKSGLIFERIKKLCDVNQLKTPKVYEIQLAGLSYRRILGLNRSIFVSPELFSVLPQTATDFLLLRELSAEKLGQSRERSWFVAAVTAALLFPYLFLVQLSLYRIPLIWVLPVWVLLYVLLVLAQSWFRSFLRTLHRMKREAFAVNLTSFQLLKRKARSSGFDPYVPALPHWKGESNFSAPLISISPPRLIALLYSVIAAFATASLFFTYPSHQLWVAVSNGNHQRAQKILEAGVSPDSFDIWGSGQTPLLAAAQKQDLKMTNLLLERGAHPNAYHPQGFQPLLIASEKGNLDLVRALLAHHATVNSAQGFRGFTPLMLAAVHGHTPVVQFLLENGASLNMRNKHQSTALLLAVQASRYETVRLLLARGANRFARDLDGDSALELAKRKKDNEMIKILEGA